MTKSADNAEKCGALGAAAKWDEAAKACNRVQGFVESFREGKDEDEEEQEDETDELSSDEEGSEESSDSDDGDDGDDLTLSLAAMEEAVFDDVMATLNEIAGTFKIYESLQERQLAGDELSEDEFQKLQFLN